MMGDNRDDSADSRFTRSSEQGVGLLPIDNVIGRALIAFFSTDGSAEWLKPWTWFTRRALGPDRARPFDATSDLADWLEATLGHRPRDLALFERALTHSSRGEEQL